MRFEFEFCCFDPCSLRPHPKLRSLLLRNAGICVTFPLPTLKEAKVNAAVNVPGQAWQVLALSRVVHTCAPC